MNGEAKIIRKVSPDKWLAVAQAIAFDDGLAHEIDTYDSKSLNQGLQHISSFSPEDLCSDFVGTIVARRAIGKGGPFAAQVTKELSLVLKALGVQTPAETLKAFNLVNNRWFKFEGPGTEVKVDYLRRRNFERTPFKAGHPSDFATPSWVVAPFGDAASFYTFQSNAGTKKVDFNDRIQQIRADAKTLYGNDFDKP